MAPRDDALLRQAAAELADVAGHLDPDALDPVVEAIVQARRVMLYGCGREGLMMRALAMRLHHLGRSVCMQGDMTAFPLAAGDLFLCAAGPGALATATALCGVARDAGARVLVVTAEPSGETARLAHDLLVIPAQTMARDMGGPSVLPMGSLFEAAMLLVSEVLVLRLRDVLGETPETMRARHTNME
ncbi:MAG: 6-phospho-3-hexuloisomerase [Chloroflexi bacterium]|nr:6-phospho-3-hexuloisomerase [Chloroflexota bacterium]